jgi:hypothetical protein
MRKLIIGLTIALMVMGLVNVATHAQGTLREYTGYQVMNLATCAGCIAHVRVDYYGPNGGAPILTKNLPEIAPKASVNVQQKTEENLPDGVYSAVLSSDQPIAAVVAQVEADPAAPGTSGFVAPYSNYTGASAGSTSVVLPSIMHNWFGGDTLVRVQNVGSATANISIQYYAATVTGQVAGQPSIAVQTRTVPQYAAATLDQSTEGNTLAATSGTFAGRFFGSAVITSDQPLVAITNETNPSLREKFTYNGFGADDSGTEVLAPAIYSRWYGTFTSTSIQNISTSQSANVTITYTGGPLAQLIGGAPGSGAGRTKTVTVTLGPGQATTRYEGAANQSDLYDTFQRFSGSARITSTGAVVAKVNQQQERAAANLGKPAGSYNAVPVNRLTNRVAAPLIQADFYGLYTSLACANASATEAATVTIEYTSDGLSARPNISGSFTHTIPAGGSLLRYERDRNGSLADINKSSGQWWDGSKVRFNGSAFITSSGPNIICTVNEQTDSLPYDNMNTYNAVNLSN